jgi:hypothetical protein
MFDNAIVAQPVFHPVDLGLFPESEFDCTVELKGIWYNVIGGISVTVGSHLEDNSDTNRVVYHITYRVDSRSIIKTIDLDDEETGFHDSAFGHSPQMALSLFAKSVVLNENRIPEGVTIVDALCKQLGYTNPIIKEV